MKVLVHLVLSEHTLLFFTIVRKMVFQVGSSFNSFDEFTAALNAYERVSFANYFKRTGPPLKIDTKYGISQETCKQFVYERLYLRCKYDGEPKQHRSVKNLRQTSSYKNKCESRINLKYDRKARKLTITELKNEHNFKICPNNAN